MGWLDTVLSHTQQDRVGTDLEARFWKKVQKSDGCWVWTGSRFKGGYGLFGIGYRTVAAHRVSYALVHDLEPEDNVLHKCDNPPCVRPDHLFKGTTQDNVRDRVAKGRTPRGVDHYAAKLNPMAVADIRSRYGPRGSGAALAREYGVSRALISMVVRGSRWL